MTSTSSQGRDGGRGGGGGALPPSSSQRPLMVAPRTQPPFLPPSPLNTPVHLGSMPLLTGAPFTHSLSATALTLVIIRCDLQRKR